MKITDIKTDYNPYKNKKLIRIPFSNMEWKFEEVENNRVKIELTAAGDPGGDIPLWFYHFVSKSMPRDTIFGLTNFVEKGGAKIEKVKYFEKLLSL